MKIKLTESQLQRVLKEVGGYDSPEVMASHAGPLHSMINSNTMSLLMLVSQLAQGLRDEELSKNQLMNGVFNLNHKISEYIEMMPKLSEEIYIDEDFKNILNKFIAALVKLNKYFRMLVGNAGNDAYGGLSFDMSQSELELEVAEKIGSLSELIKDLGNVIVQVFERFNDRTSSMNEQEGEENSTPEGPHDDYYDVGLALRRIVVNKDTGEWIDTDYLEEESIQTSWDLKDAEKMYQRKLYELKFFDTKGKMSEHKDTIKKILSEYDFETKRIETDPRTGSVTWDVIYSFKIEDIYEDLDEIIQKMKRAIEENPKDSRLTEIWVDAKNLRNRVHRVITDPR